MNVPNLVPDFSSPLLTSGFVSEPKCEEKAILLVEDDSALRRYLQIILERSGFYVVTARDGMDAMSKLETYSFAVIVTDGVMPYLDGYELCRFVRKHETLSQTPVILLSGLDHEDSDEELNARADVYLSKPVSPDDLVRHLESLMPIAASATSF
jgi:DNA-binding response OmpR family regulator